jgi:hypothetical protein
MSLENPFVLEDVLSEDLFYDVWNELHPEHNGWFYNNAANYNDGYTSWGRDPDECTNSALRAATFVKLKSERILKRRLTLIKIQHNLQTPNQVNLFHTDFNYDDIFSIILFTTPTWSVRWSGEFCVQTPDKKYNYYPYIPNTAVGIKSNWTHYGMASNQLAFNKVRTSLAFSYVYSDMFNKIYMKHIMDGAPSHHFRRFNNKVEYIPDDIPVY